LYLYLYLYLLGDDLLEFHQAVLSTLRDAEDGSMQCDTTSLPSLPPHNPLLTHTHEDLARLSETHTDLEHDQDDISDNGNYSRSKITWSFQLVNLLVFVAILECVALCMA